MVLIASPHDIIRQTVHEVCRDGNADSGTVARAVIAALQEAGYMTDQFGQMLDIRADETTVRQVELKVGTGTVWVNIDGICRLRICNLRPHQITIDDERAVVR